MAYIRAHETSQKRKGRAVKRYEVVWREPVRDDYGVPVVLPTGKTKTRARQESFATREDAEARRDELNAAKPTGQTSALAEQRKAGDLPVGHFAREFFASMRGTVKPRTLSEAEAVYRRYIADAFGQRAIATVTAADVRHFRAELLSPRPRRSYDTRSGEPKPTDKTVTFSRSTVKKAWDCLRRIFDVAVVDGAIKANPVHSVPLPRHAATARTADASSQDAARAEFKALPLLPAQIAAVADYIANEQHQPTYALAVTFSAYTGLRAGELRGLEIGDLTLPKTPGAMGIGVSPVNRSGWF